MTVNGPLELCHRLEVPQSADSSSEDEEWRTQYQRYCEDYDQLTKGDLLPIQSSEEAVLSSVSPPHCGGPGLP